MSTDLRDLTENVVVREPTVRLCVGRQLLLQRIESHERKLPPQGLSNEILSSHPSACNGLAQICLQLPVKFDVQRRHA